MEIKPSNPKIVHHVVIYAIEPDAPPGTPEGGVQLHEYAVGKYGDIFSDNTGRLLKKGTRLRFDMHYFAIGEELPTRPTMAFIFYPKGFMPKYQVRSMSIPQHAERRARDSAEHGGRGTTATSGCRRPAASTPSSRTCTCAARG